MSIDNKLIVHGLMKINDYYLVIKRTIIKRGKPNAYPGYWDTPGGLVENGELPKQALVRECKEEVGLNVRVGKIIHEDSNLDKTKNCIFTRLIYLCDIIDQSEYDIVLQKDEHSEYRLIKELSDLDKELIAPFLEEIFSNKINK